MVLVQFLIITRSPQKIDFKIQKNIKTQLK